MYMWGGGGVRSGFLGVAYHLTPSELLVPLLVVVLLLGLPLLLEVGLWPLTLLPEVSPLTSFRTTDTVPLRLAGT